MINVAFFTFLTQIIDIVTHCAPADFHVMGKPLMVSDEDKAEVVQDADFLLLHAVTIAERALRAARRLRLIQLFGARYEKMNLLLLEKLKIPIANMSGLNSEGVAEMAITLMLAIYRRLVLLGREMRAGQWRSELTSGFDTFELA